MPTPIEEILIPIAAVVAIGLIMAWMLGQNAKRFEAEEAERHLHAAPGHIHLFQRQPNGALKEVACIPGKVPVPQVQPIPDEERFYH
jgi:hypothetical protein